MERRKAGNRTRVLSLLTTGCCGVGCGSKMTKTRYDMGNGLLLDIGLESYYSELGSVNCCLRLFAVIFDEY
jgi:hypothetical protein